MWTLQSAVELIRNIQPMIVDHKYYLGLTGSVLFEGESNNDLDLILYPKHDPKTDYLPCLEILKKNLNVKYINPIVRKRWESPQYKINYKLVYRIRTNDDKNIDLFIPSFSYAERLVDNLQSYVTTNYSCE